MKVLKPALLCLFQNAPKEIDYRHVASNTKSDSFLTAFDREIDATFFDALFEELELDDHDAKEDARRRWLLGLKAEAEAILATAESGSPISQVRRYQSRAAAHRKLQGAFFGQFKPLFPTPAKDAP